MTREERQAAVAVIGEAEVRCHGWAPEAVDALRADIAAWWKRDAGDCEAYLAETAAMASAYLAQLTRRAA